MNVNQSKEMHCLLVANLKFSLVFQVTNLTAFFINAHKVEVYRTVAPFTHITRSAIKKTDIIVSL